MKQIHLSFVGRVFGLASLAAFALLPSTLEAQLLISTGAVWRYFDAGMQPAPDWMARNFPDFSWKSGRAELGFGDGDEVTIINSTNESGPLITAYFRRTFFVRDAANVRNLTLQLFRDDGAVVYINGTEVLRDNMPAGPVSYSTLAVAAAPDDGNVPVRATLGPETLVPFTNVIAVEIHQNSPFSSDLSFDLLLAANTNRAPVAHSQSVTTRQNTPVNITLTGSDPEGDPLTYTIRTFPTHGTLSGTAPNVTYTPHADYVGPDSFTFTVNDGRLNSQPATVHVQVLPPPDPPEVVSAIADCSLPQVVVTFNEPVEPVTAEDTFNYQIRSPDNSFVATIVSASLGPDQQTVTLTLDPQTPLIPGNSYLLDTIGICDTSGDCSDFQTTPIQFETEPPLVGCSVEVNTLLPANNHLIDVGLSASASEGIQVQVFSDEPELPFLPDAVFDGPLQLRARKSPSSNGRVYLIVVTSTDPCGNTGVCCTTVVVPAGGSQAALNAVMAEAAAAQAQCSPTGSPLTPHQILP